MQRIFIASTVFLTVSLLVHAAFIEPNIKIAIVIGFTATLFALLLAVYVLKNAPKNSTMRTMSIIGIVIFLVSLIFIPLFAAQDKMKASGGWGVIALIYAIPYSIVGIVKSGQKGQPSAANYDEIQKFHELFKSGALTEAEFNAVKKRILEGSGSDF